MPNAVVRYNLVKASQPLESSRGSRMKWVEVRFRDHRPITKEVNPASDREVIGPSKEALGPHPHGAALAKPLTKASRSVPIVFASVVGMPCGKPLYVFNVLFLSSFAESGAESA